MPSPLTISLENSTRIQGEHKETHDSIYGYGVRFTGERSEYVSELNSIGSIRRKSYYIDTAQLPEVEKLQQGHIVQVKFRKQTNKTPYIIQYIDTENENGVLKMRNQADIKTTNIKFTAFLEPVNHTANGLVVEGHRKYADDKVHINTESLRFLEIKRAMAVKDIVHARNYFQGYTNEKPERKVMEKRPKEFFILPDSCIAEAFDAEEELLPLLM